MKKTIQLLIVFLFGINVLVHVMTKQFQLVLISYELGTLMFVISFIISILFVMVLWRADEKYQNIAIGILVVAYLLSFRVQLLLPLTLLCLRTLVRYEDNLLNKVTKISGIIFGIITIGNLVFLPAVASGYQEEGFDVHNNIESENHLYIAIIRGYETSEYNIGVEVNNRVPITLCFNEIQFGIFRHEIEEIEVPYQHDISYEWIEENKIKIYDVLYELTEDQVIIK